MSGRTSVNQSPNADLAEYLQQQSQNLMHILYEDSSRQPSRTDVQSTLKLHREMIKQSEKNSPVYSQASLFTPRQQYQPDLQIVGRSEVSEFIAKSESRQERIVKDFRQ